MEKEAEIYTQDYYSEGEVDKKNRTADMAEAVNQSRYAAYA